MRMRLFSILTILTLSFTSCGMKTFFESWKNSSLKRMGHSVQVGAFSDMRYAVNLEKKLRYWGVDAFHFRHADGLYKVRFGDYQTYAEARNAALRIRREGLIGGFFVIRPNSYAASKLAIKRDRADIPAKKTKGSPGTHQPGTGRSTPDHSGVGRTGDNRKPDIPSSSDYSLNDLRKDLINTARRFLGIPYRWGGTNADSGFDCSGLTLTVYRLNGFRLPRNAASQMRAGRRVPKERLLPGDLVFFDTVGRGAISHVGIYHGNGSFIHAPRRGKSVEITRMDRGYFKRTFRGGCRYF